VDYENFNAETKFQFSQFVKYDVISDVFILNMDGHEIKCEHTDESCCEICVSFCLASR